MIPPVYLLYLWLFAYLRIHHMDFPGGPVVRTPPANAGDMGLIPGPERFHMAQTKPVHHNHWSPRAGQPVLHKRSRRSKTLAHGN